MKKWCPKIETVRIEIEPGRVIQAISWLQQACGHGYKVIATYHNDKVMRDKDKKKISDPNELLTAAYWWKYNYGLLRTTPLIHRVKQGEILMAIAELYYSGAEKGYSEIFQANNLSRRQFSQNLLLNIPFKDRSFRINLMNEWGDHKTTAKQYADAYNAAIKIIRDEAHYQGPLIIDVPAGQETAVAASAVKGDGTDRGAGGGTDRGAHGFRINDANIILSVHIYRDSDPPPKGIFPANTKPRPNHCRFR